MNKAGQASIEQIMMIGGAIVFVVLVSIVTRSVITQGGDNTGSAAKVIATKENVFKEKPTTIDIIGLICNPSESCGYNSFENKTCPMGQALVKSCTSTCEQFCSGDGSACQSCTPPTCNPECAARVCDPPACPTIQQTFDYAGTCVFPKVKQSCVASCQQPCDGGLACGSCTITPCTPTCLTDCPNGRVDFTCACEGGIANPGSGYCCGNVLTQTACPSLFSKNIDDDVYDRYARSSILQPDNLDSIFIGTNGANLPFSTVLKINQVPIPFGSKIINSNATFLAYDSQQGNNASIRIYGELSIAPADFTNNENISNRIKTENYVNWTLNSTWVNRRSYFSPDLTPIIQELVNQTGWTNGSSFILMFIDFNSSTTSRRNIRDRENRVDSFRLNVTYLPAG